MLMIGPPGAGKSMLAKRIPTILPRMSLEEALETTRIHSSAGYLPSGRALVATRPFLNPHHTVSYIAFIGGGELRPQRDAYPLELPQSRRDALEALHQTLTETGA